MKRGLVVIDDVDLVSESTKKLLRDTGELAAGSDAELVLLRVADIGDYEETRRSMSSSKSGMMYTIEQEREATKKKVEKLAETVLDGIDVSYESFGVVGREKREIFRVAEEMDCDHIFMVGKKRSPAGKALFGNLAQSVILNFDGPVTVMVE